MKLKGVAAAAIGEEEGEEQRDEEVEEGQGEVDRCWYSRVRSIINRSRNADGLATLDVTQDDAASAA